jgi:hypothetical protein
LKAVEGHGRPIHSKARPLAALNGTHKSAKSQQESHDETVKLLRLMDLEGDVRVKDGAAHAIPGESTRVDSPGARLIIEEATKDDKRPLHIAFYGHLAIFGFLIWVAWVQLPSSVFSPARANFSAK